MINYWRELFSSDFDSEPRQQQQCTMLSSDWERPAENPPHQHLLCKTPVCGHTKVMVPYVYPEMKNVFAQAKESLARPCPSISRCWVLPGEQNDNDFRIAIIILIMIRMISMLTNCWHGMGMIFWQGMGMILFGRAWAWYCFFQGMGRFFPDSVWAW